jgi:hypothetical protein
MLLRTASPPVSSTLAVELVGQFRDAQRRGIGEAGGRDPQRERQLLAQLDDPVMFGAASPAPVRDPHEQVKGVSIGEAIDRHPPGRRAGGPSGPPAPIYRLRPGRG